MQQLTRFFTTSDAVRIAYCSQGDGPPLVYVRGWLSHLELFWENPRFRAYFEPLTRHFRLVRYDMRGNGLSERHPETPDLDATVRDLETVMDGLGLGAATLYGQTYGGPTAIAYAARHPERVAALILDTTYARGHDMYPADQHDRFIRMLRDDPDGAMFRVSYVTDPEPQTGVTLRDHYRDITSWQLRVSAEMLPKLYTLGYETDVSDLLPSISAPTLVMHRRENRAVPLRLGRELASRIQDVRFVALPGAASNPWDGDAAAALAAVGDFLGVELELASTGTGEPARGRALQTLMFTDMRGSTALTQRVGDARAQEVLRTHNTIVRAALKRHSGSEIKHTGDGIMASFGSASRAVECAISIQRALALLDDVPPVRIGLNAGEPVAEEDDLFGTAVQLAARVCDHAEAGQILASNVVRELCAGKGFPFADAGNVTLHGFEDPAHLFSLDWRIKD